MYSLFKNQVPTFYETENQILLLGDSLLLLNSFLERSVNLIFADPPYFLSNDGVTCNSGKMVSVNKGDWDKSITSEEKLQFNRTWLKSCYNILADDGTIWVSGTLHNIYSIGMALELEGFKILNNITWQKTNPPPNLACKCFTHSTETILWAKKADAKHKHFFNYQLMKELNGGKQMKDVWSGSLIPKNEKKFGKHPTQKPLYLLERIILASSRENDIVLDPFCGSSTTGVATKKLNRRYIGIDSSKEYLELSIKRLEEELI